MDHDVFGVPGAIVTPAIKALPRPETTRLSKQIQRPVSCLVPGAESLCLISGLFHPAPRSIARSADPETDIMQRSSSFGTSWADQWDNGDDPSPRAAGDGGGKQMQGAVGKTKAAAATGLRKVKEGTTQGFR
jgi:hypothetical protein